MSSRSSSSSRSTMSWSTSSIDSVLDRGLPEGWQVTVCRTSGRRFYYNSRLNKSQWRRPREPSPKPPGYRRLRRSRRLRRLPIRSATSSSEEESNETVNCSHILIKHKFTRRPYNWRLERIKRSRQDAKKFSRGLRQDLIYTDLRFETVADKYSECPSSLRYGDLGTIYKGKMHLRFEQEVFNMDVGNISDVVETRSGFHIIRRNQ